MRTMTHQAHEDNPSHITPDTDDFVWHVATQGHSPGAETERSSMNQRNGPASSTSTAASNPAGAIHVSRGLVHHDGAKWCGNW